MASKRIGLLLILTAVVFAFVGIVDSALVVRPTKTCGNQTYVEEVADGCTTILAVEVDDDLQAIIDAGVNNIEEDNLADDSVSTAKIQDEAVTTGKIDDEAVTTAKIDDGAVNSAKILDGAIVNADVNASAAIVGTKLAVNATQNNFTSKAADLGISGTGVGFWVQPSPSITTRGGRVMIFGNVTAFGVMSSEETVIIRIRRDATTATDGTEIARADILLGSGTTSTLEAHAIPFPAFIDSPTAGGHTYSVTLEFSGTGVYATDASNAGTMFVLELT